MADREFETKLPAAQNRQGSGMDAGLQHLLAAIHSGLQGASNGIAQTVTLPVDGLAWLLQQAGVDVGSSPIGGDAWARRVGLIQAPQNQAAGAIGEGLGLAGTAALTPGNLASIRALYGLAK